MIKLNQNIFGQRTGFILALALDMLFGSFTDSPLSFCYSFLFLGIIYSGSSLLFLWFFFGQSLIAYFSGDLISPLIMIFSPLLNVAFAIAMPLLFLLAFPLWYWQVQLGLTILSGLQKLVEISAHVSHFVPSCEINIGVLLCFGLFYFRKKIALSVSLLFLTLNLNQDHNKIPSFGRYEFVPNGGIVKIISNETGETVYFSDGKCKRELIRGVWWEKCSPRRRSKNKKIKKLSSL